MLLVGLGEGVSGWERWWPITGGTGCVYIRGLGYLGRTWWRRLGSRRPVWTGYGYVVWENASLLLATQYGAIA
jgi:hypothetical protein